MYKDLIFGNSVFAVWCNLEITGQYVAGLCELNTGMSFSAILMVQALWTAIWALESFSEHRSSLQLRGQLLIPDTESEMHVQTALRIVSVSWTAVVQTERWMVAMLLVAAAAKSREINSTQTWEDQMW